MNSPWSAPRPATIPVAGSSDRLPVHRIFCVGRNYQAHAKEMGVTVDKSVERAFYFTKSPAALVDAGGSVAYAPGTADLHHEMELVVVIGKPGFEVSPADAPSLIHGYACGLDMTRRDLQNQAKEQRRPWSLAKDFEQSAVIAPVVTMPGTVLSRGAIELSVNGRPRQKGDLADLIWSIPEVIADLSRYYHLQPGDLVYTGTPEGVAAVKRGDVLHGRVEGVGELRATIA